MNWEGSNAPAKVVREILCPLARLGRRVFRPHERRVEETTGELPRIGRDVVARVVLANDPADVGEDLLGRRARVIVRSRGGG